MDDDEKNKFSQVVYIDNKTLLNECIENFQVDVILLKLGKLRELQWWGIIKNSWRKSKGIRQRIR